MIYSYAKFNELDLDLGFLIIITAQPVIIVFLINY